MRIPVRLLVSAVLIGSLVPAFLLLSGTWYPTAHRDHFTTTTVLHKNNLFHTEADDLSSTASHKPVHKISSDSWRDHIQKTCHKFGFIEDHKDFDPTILKRSKILVDDKNKLLYCQIPKVASTTWRRILIVLTGKVGTKDPMSLSANDVHHKYNQHLTYLNDFGYDDIVYRLQNYFKFIFVREPFERLLSAFRNKFLATTNSSLYFKNAFGKKIISQYRPNQSETTTDSNLNFGEFVKYLIDPDKTIPMNEHWDRFYKLCHPCWINYDFIGKLETLEEDSKYILESNSLSGKVKVPSRSDSRYSNRKTKSYMYEYYSKIPRTYLQKLYEMYHADFVIFNFTVPEVIQSLMRA